MSKTFAKSLGLGVGVLALAACNPYPSSPGVTLTLSAPPTVSVDGADQVQLEWDATATIDGEFTLGESACDPADVTVNTDTGALIAGWDPYACADENGDPIPGHGNLQFFVDGIFMGYYTDTTIPVDLKPNGDASDPLRLAYYVDADGDGAFTAADDIDGDGKADAIAACYFYYPADNLGYAKTLFDTFMVDGYKPADYYGIDGSVYDLNADGSVTEVTGDDIAPDGIAGADYYQLWPWTTFEYFGVNVDEALIEGYSDFDPYVDGQHIFYAELHYDNHSPVYGAGRQRYVMGQLDVNSMPDNWCGYLAGLGNPVWFY